MRFFRGTALLILVVCGPAGAQPLAERYADLGTMVVTTSPHAPFPSEKRANGHTYEGKTYPADVHYSDSTVAIFVPKGFRPGETTNLVFWFHGWKNSVDGALAQFRLVEQFVASGVNAVFVHPEGPKNAPDSSGGKLEEPGVFSNLVADVLSTLKERGIVPSARPGSIVLAGHSGAYRVMAFILARGGLTPNVQEVYLFDALYGQMEKYAHWIDRSPGRLVDVHTADGGTRAATLDLADDLKAWGIPFVAVSEDAATAELLRKNRVVLIASPLAHDDVVAAKDQFRRYLETGSLPRR